MVKDRTPHPAELQFKFTDREQLPRTTPSLCRAVPFFDCVNLIWEHYTETKDTSLFHGVSDVLVSLWEMWDDYFFQFEAGYPIASARLKELNSKLDEKVGFSEHFDGLFREYGFPWKLMEGMLKRLAWRLRSNAHSVRLGIPNDTYKVFEEWAEDLFVNCRHDKWRQEALLWKFIY